jgi:hypothetical protein
MGDANPVRVARDHDDAILGLYTLQVPGSGVAREGELDFMFVANDQQGRGSAGHCSRTCARPPRRSGWPGSTIVSHPPSEPFYLACGAERVGTKPPVGRVTWARP